MCVICATKSSKNFKNVAVGLTKEVENGFASLVYNMAHIPHTFICILSLSLSLGKIISQIWSNIGFNINYFLPFISPHIHLYSYRLRIGLSKCKHEITHGAR